LIAQAVQEAKALGLSRVFLHTTDQVEFYIRRGWSLVGPANHYGRRVVIMARETGAAPIEAACEECGRRSLFERAQRSTVQSCPHCGAYIDVDDPGERDSSRSDLAGTADWGTAP
jgi:hypothetical protein